MLKYLIRKEFLQIRRNSFLPRLIVIFPIMVMCIMPWVMSMEVKNIVVDVVDNDRSTLSQRLVHDIEQNRYFIFNGQKATYSAALEDIEMSRADVILVIPQDYGRDISQGRHSPVLIAANAVNGTKGSIGASYLGRIVTPALPGQENETITKLLYNPHQNYKLFMIPALLAIVIMMMTGFLPALNIVGEKETGTIEQINVTPVSKWSFILAKLIPYWVIALFVITVCLLLSWLLYGVTCRGSLLLVYLLVMLLSLFFSSFGLVVSNYSDTMQQAILVMWFVVVCMMLMSGLFTPTRSMPQWAYMTTYINPMHFFIDAVRTVFVRGGGFGSIIPQVAILTGLSSVMALWAVASYKKNA